MPSQQLEPIKSKHRSLSPQIDALANYVSHELDEGRRRIVPALAAAYLRQSEAETLALLMLFEDAGLLAHEYDIICKSTNAVLLTVSALSELEDILPIHCPLEDVEHDADDLRVELVFQVKPSAMQVFQQHAFA